MLSHVRTVLCYYGISLIGSDVVVSVHEPEPVSAAGDEQQRRDEEALQLNIKTANKWEQAQLAGDNARKNKFLRLMGATRVSISLAPLAVRPLSSTADQQGGHWSIPCLCFLPHLGSGVTALGPHKPRQFRPKCYRLFLYFICCTRRLFH